MNWFVVAITIPIIYTIGHYVDKYVLSLRRKERAGPGTIVIFSWFFAVLTLGLIVVGGAELSVHSPGTALLLVFSGFIAMTATALYLYALDKDEVSVVVPLIQLTPVFGFIFGYLFLGETISILKGLSAVVVIAASVFLTLEIAREEGQLSHVRWKKRLFLISSLAALLFALSGTIFKFVALERGYWTAQFWEYVGVSLFGFLFFIFATRSRHAFLSIIRKGRKKYISLVSTAEVLMVGGDLVTNFATLLAPIVLIYVVSSLQISIVLIFGVLFSVFIPSFIKEDLTKEHLIQKVISIAFITLGTIGLNLL